MSDEKQEYAIDTRTICKYGIKCYQKNPEHHAKYKHPLNNLKNNHEKRKNRRFSPYTKKRDSNSPIADTNVVEPETSNSVETSTRTDFESNIDTPEKIVSTLEQETIEPQVKENLSINLPNDITFYDSISDNKKFEELFLYEMPPDFFKFYECLSDDNNIEKTLAGVNLELIGPYDLLQGKLPVLEDKELYLVHWRFFYDPPEFQAVLKKKGKSELHIGYYRDDPKEKPVFLASNDSTKDCQLKPMAENIFGAVYMYLQNEKKSSPFISIACQKLMDKVKKYAEQHNFSLEQFNMKKRQGKIVSKSFHGAGIVVPYDKKTQQGYRHLVENDATIKKMFTKLAAAKSQSEKDEVLSELQPVITYATIAVDECDFGTGVEAGINLFCSGIKELEPSALSSLTAVYPLLNRAPFSKIIQAHLKYRRKGPNMSLLSLNDS